MRQVDISLLTTRHASEARSVLASLYLLVPTKRTPVGVVGERRSCVSVHCCPLSTWQGLCLSTRQVETDSLHARQVQTLYMPGTHSATCQWCRSRKKVAVSNDSHCCVLIRCLSRLMSFETKISFETDVFRDKDVFRD